MDEADFGFESDPGPLETTLGDPDTSEYWFNISGDNEIPNETMCQYLSHDQTKGIFANREFVCEEALGIPANIYGDEEDFDDPCEE